MKKIIVCGGDGFCGWPLSLKLSKMGYDVSIIDNFSRRKIDKELNSNSLVNIYPLRTRIKKWYEITGKKINFHNLDLSKDTEKLGKLIKNLKPKAIYMFAELKSAPYSMMSLKHSNKNLMHNLIVNNNLLYLIKKYSPKTHYIHLGTMGVYGYDFGKIEIPEGYLKVKIFDKIKKNFYNKEILHPSNPGSIYHLTKVNDENLFQFYQKMYNVKITDLHQGIVWGCNTEETNLDYKLYNRFDYDHIYGTFLNRLIIQAAAKHPLTLHGSGNQLRPFINLENAIQVFIEVLKINSFKRVNIINEFGEILRLKDLAKIISNKFNLEIKNYQNPRIEKENNLIKASTNYIKKKKFEITNVTIKQIENLNKLAVANKNKINKSKIFIKGVKW